MLKLENISNFILKNISFEVEKGEIFVILGQNGSGKTTLLKTIIGLEKVDSGKIIFKGKDITNLPIYDRVKLGIGYMMQNIPEYIGIKIKHYIKGILKDKFDENLVRQKFKELGLDWDYYKNRDFDARLSGGEKKKIEIIVNFLLDRDLYLLDEIETSLDANSFNVVKNWILQEKKKDKSFIIVSHIVDLIKLGNRGILLCNGEVDRKGDINLLLDKYLNKCLHCKNLHNGK